MVMKSELQKISIRLPLLGFLILLFSYSPASCQINFENIYEDPDFHSFGKEIFRTDDGGYFVQGTIESGFTKCIIMRLDSLGNTVDSLVYGTDTFHQFKAYDMIKSQDGTFVITGDHQIDTSLYWNGMDSYLQKLDEHGNELWLNVYGSYNVSSNVSKDHGNAIRQLDNSNYVVFGMAKDFYFNIDSTGYGAFWNAYLAIFDNDGNMLQRKSIITLFDSLFWENSFYARSLTAIQNKIYCLATYSTDTSQNTWLLAFNEHTDTLFSIRDLKGEYYGYGLVAANNETLLLYSDSSFTFMDTAGNILWRNSFNLLPKSVNIRDVIELSNGNFMAISSQQASLFDNAYPDGYYNDTNLVVIFDHAGNVQETYMLADSSGTINQNIYAIIATSDGGCAFTGFHDKKMWVVKTDSSVFEEFTSIPELPESTSITLYVYPNPASSYCYLSSTIKEPSILNIRDALGRIMFHEAVLPSSFPIKINTEEFDNGLYLLSLYYGREHIEKKLVVTR
jgi:hypothetical protein